MNKRTAFVLWNNNFFEEHLNYKQNEIQHRSLNGHQTKIRLKVGNIMTTI